MPFTPEDAAHMRAALALASRNLGRTWPNPAVGCVIVRDGEVVAEAATAAGGRPHAEEQAVPAAGEQPLSLVKTTSVLPATPALSSAASTSPTAQSVSMTKSP